ncbi:hypothetical protein KKH36_02940 [Patescibacteria group bacterium]|nr:hypothetical protein [Patescibacteria group bacterium]
MKVLIIIGRNPDGKREAVREEFSSWKEAIERSPEGEFAVIENELVFLFFEKLENILSCTLSSKNGYLIDNYTGSKAVEEFDRLVNSCP